MFFCFLLREHRPEKKRGKITPPPGADLNPVLLEGNKPQQTNVNGSHVFILNTQLAVVFKIIYRPDIRNRYPVVC